MVEEEPVITAGDFEMAKKTGRSPFGERLARLRKENGLTQEEFAEKIGISRRALAYYETETQKLPDGETVLRMANTLDISVDQILGAKQIRRKRPSPKEARLINKLRRVEKLPPNDQKAVLKYIDALIKVAQEA